MEELKEFVDSSQEAGMRVALAGSLKLDHMDALKELGPDIIGVRGAVCEGKDRKTRISPEQTDHFVALFHEHAPAQMDAAARPAS